MGAGSWGVGLQLSSSLRVVGTAQDLAWGIPVSNASKVQGCLVSLIWLVSTWPLLLCQSLPAGLGGSWCCG